MAMMRKAISNEVCNDHDDEKCSSNRNEYDSMNNNSSSSNSKEANATFDELNLSKWGDRIH